MQWGGIDWGNGDEGKGEKKFIDVFLCCFYLMLSQWNLFPDSFVNIPNERLLINADILINHLFQSVVFNGLCVVAHLSLGECLRRNDNKK